MLDRGAIERLSPPVIVALSGGGDSVALLHLLRAEFGPAQVRALVVDHALRHGSAADAARAAGFAEALGVETEIVTLTWPDGPNRAQQAAREARYRALCEAARRIGARAICVAHSADDQAETVLMRAAAGSQWRGLAGIAPIAPAPVWPEGRGIILVRPLLDVRRAALRSYLRGLCANWLEDPANANEAFERVRVRARLAALEQGGFDPLKLAALARKMRALADAVDRDASALIARAVRFENARAVIARAAWKAPEETRRRALSVLITAASGSAREPQAAALARLETRFAQESFRGAALGGARVSCAGELAHIVRDPGALTGRADGASGLAPLAVAAHSEQVWDGRLALTPPESGWSVVADVAGPVLVKGERRIAGADLEAEGFRPVWLVEARVRALLGSD